MESGGRNSATPQVKSVRLEFDHAPAKNSLLLQSRFRQSRGSILPAPVIFFSTDFGFPP
jgi:hypothetical protein